MCGVVFKTYLVTKDLLFLPEQEVCVGESWPRLWVQAKCTCIEGWMHDRGQDSPIQTD